MMTWPLEISLTPPPDRFTVLEEIISVLVSKQLIGDLMRPQAAYSHYNVREIIEDVTQSSAMRLDSTSMNKLWDLITMIFKWQVTMSEDLIGITLRHLYEIEHYVTNTDTHNQLQRVQNIVENFNKILEYKEKAILREEVLYWLREYNVRVSLLLRMGLQTLDAKFVVNNLEPVAEEMLRNLGENVYQVTQNGRILENREDPPTPNQNLQPTDVNEMELFAQEMLGDRKLSTGSTESNTNCFKLTINDENSNQVTEKKIPKLTFDCIDVNVDGGNLEDLMSDVSLKNDTSDGSFQDELLDMIGGDENCNE